MVMEASGDTRLLPDKKGQVFFANKQKPINSIAIEQRVAIIACGALAHEIMQLIRLNDFHHIQLFCLPANLHNRPKQIVPALREKLTELQNLGYQKIVIGYGDCGTGGGLDKFIAEHGLTRIDGAHCYAFFSGLQQFDEMMEQEIGTFFLTDYMAKFFDSLIIKGLGIDKHPELKKIYFANYKKLTYLAQTNDVGLQQKAKDAAIFLGLDYQFVQTDYGLLADFIEREAS